MLASEHVSNLSLSSMREVFLGCSKILGAVGVGTFLLSGIFFLSRRPFCVEEMPVNGAPNGENPQVSYTITFWIPIAFTGRAQVRMGCAAEQAGDTGVCRALGPQEYSGLNLQSPTQQSYLVTLLTS